MINDPKWPLAPVIAIILFFVQKIDLFAFRKLYVTDIRQSHIEALSAS